MSQVSKLIFPLAAIFATTCLAPNCCTGQGSLTVKLGVARSSPMPTLDGVLAPGNVFDKQIAGSHMPGQPSQIHWFKVPAWYVGTWTSSESVRTFMRNEFTGEEKLNNPMQPSHNEIWGGTCMDRDGQVWECEDTGYWRYSDTGTLDQNTYVLNHTPLNVTDTSCCFHASAIVFTVEKISGKILHCSQSEHDEFLTPMSDNVMRAKIVQRNFDWQGNPTTTEEGVSIYERIRSTVLPNPVACSDNKPLYPRFVQYLKDNGLSDRVPEVSPKTEAVQSP